MEVTATTETLKIILKTLNEKALLLCHATMCTTVPLNAMS